MKMCKMKDYKGDIDWKNTDQANVFHYIECMEIYLSQMPGINSEFKFAAKILQDDLDNLKYALGVMKIVTKITAGSYPLIPYHNISMIACRKYMPAIEYMPAYNFKLKENICSDPNYRNFIQIGYIYITEEEGRFIPNKIKKPTYYPCSQVIYQARNLGLSVKITDTHIILEGDNSGEFNPCIDEYANYEDIE